MTVTNFLAAVEQIADVRPAYRKGHFGADGYCDCIGLVIGALRRCGILWTGTHGTNWAARHAVKDLRPVTHVSDLSPGDLVFRAFHPWDPDWSLPSAYSGDPDQLDYYHVGVVTGVSPLKITHMTSPSIRRDTSLSRWTHTARLTCLSTATNKGDDLLMHATVTSEDGNPVKLRSSPDTDHPYLEKLPVGASVYVISKAPDWTHVMSDTRIGYIMTKFLVFEDAPATDPDNADDDTFDHDADPTDVVLILPRPVVEILRDRLNEIFD